MHGFPPHFLRNWPLIRTHSHITAQARRYKVFAALTVGSVQRMLLEAMDAEQTTPSLSQAQRLKKFSQEGRLTEEAMSAIMSEEKKSDMDKVTLRSDTLRRYFPKSYTPKQMEQTIIKLLDVWQKQRQKNQER